MSTAFADDVSNGANPALSITFNEPPPRCTATLMLTHGNGRVYIYCQDDRGHSGGHMARKEPATGGVLCITWRQP